MSALYFQKQGKKLHLIFSDSPKNVVKIWYKMSLKILPAYRCSPGKAYTVDWKANFEKTVLTFQRGSLGFLLPACIYCPCCPLVLVMTCWLLLLAWLPPAFTVLKTCSSKVFKETSGINVQVELRWVFHCSAIVILFKTPLKFFMWDQKEPLRLVFGSVDWTGE